MRNILFFPRWVIIRMIKLYQVTLSPDHGPLRHLYTYGYCRHSPTCSDYALQQIQHHGVIVGMPKTLWRVLRCNPWTKPSEERILEVLQK